MPSELRSSLGTWISDPVKDTRVRLLAEELNRNPVGVVKRFRRLHAEANDEPSTLSEKSPFIKLALRLDDAVNHLVNGDHEKATPLVHAGIVEAYIAAVKTKDFFTWPLKWRAAILEVLVIVIVFAQSNPTARERICRTTKELFCSIWDRRAVVRLTDRGAHHGGCALDDTTMLPTLIDAYYDAFSESDRAPAFETYIHHVELLTWVLSREEHGMRGIGLHPMLMLSLYAAWGPTLSDMEKAEREGVKTMIMAEYYDVRDHFVKECIVDGIGGDRMIDACEVELQNLVSHNDCNCESHMVDLRRLVEHILGGEVSTPLIYRRDLLGYSIEILRQLFATEFGAPMCTNLCLFCTHLVLHYDIYQRMGGEKSAMPFRHPDIVDLFVAGVELAAGGCNMSATYGDLQGALTKTINLAVTRIQEDIDEQGGELPEYISSLQIRAGPLYSPSFRRLQLAAPLIEREELNRTLPVTDLLESWTAFGSLIGIDATDERRRYNRDKEEYCHWSGCQRRASDGVTALRKCAGCGEARYCSKECQKLDWKEGGHKKDCRRLK